MAVANEPYDLLLLDPGLPGKSGLEVLRTLRRQSGRVEPGGQRTFAVSASFR